MSIFNRKEKRSKGLSLVSLDGWEDIICGGYTPLYKNPEIVAGCRRIAELISSMTIHLRSNSENGDERIVNALSKKVDITPSKYMTRKTWLDAIVMNLLLYGDGNSVVRPRTVDGLLDELEVIPASRVSFLENPDRHGYKVLIDGIPYEPENLLHFVDNPDKEYMWKGQGIKVAMKDIAKILNQARETEKSFMESKWKPSIIIKADAMIEEFGTPEGREELLKKYIENEEAGKPWVIPADAIDVKEVKPLSLSDLAINDTVKIDKRTAAAIIGVPSFVLGEGTYTDAEWNNFINSYIRPKAQIIEQELTKKLLINDKWYFKLNVRSLYAYDIQKLAAVGYDGYTRGILTGNEVRDQLGYDPKDNLDELVVLENYIPLGMIGDQKKLNQESNND